jgi:hypothetical protein
VKPEKERSFNIPAIRIYASMGVRKSLKSIPI